MDLFDLIQIFFKILFLFPTTLHVNQRSWAQCLYELPISIMR